MILPPGDLPQAATIAVWTTAGEPANDAGRPAGDRPDVVGREPAARVGRLALEGQAAAGHGAAHPLELGRGLGEAHATLQPLDAVREAAHAEAGSLEVERPEHAGRPHLPGRGQHLDHLRARIRRQRCRHSIGGVRREVGQGKVNLPLVGGHGRIARRAQILLSCAEVGQRVVLVSDKVDQNRTTVWRVCERYREAGLTAALYDAPRTGHPRVFSR